MNPVKNISTSRERELSSELRQAQQQIADLRRQITGLERDNRLLSIMSENADRLRRASEAEKKLQHLYQSMLLRHCPSMLFIFDEDLRLALAAGSCLSILPFHTIDDMLHLDFADVFGSKMQPEWIERLTDECRKAMQSRRASSYDERIEFAFEAGSMEAQIGIAPIIEEDSAVLKGVLLSIADLTEFSVLNRRAEEYAERVSNLMEQVAQELSAPLDTIKGLSELLMLGGGDEAQHEYAGDLLATSSALLTRVRDITDLSRIREGGPDIICSEYNLGTLLKDACCAASLKAEEKGLLLVTEIEPGLPAALVGDEERVRQVLSNLLGNAVKHTDKGTITLKVDGELEGGNLSLVMQVIDTGLGFKHEDIPELFEPFRRTDDGLIGAGDLGLAISLGLARAMEGDVSVESVYGQGSIFTFKLPQKVAKKARLAEVQYPERRKVLLLDDGPRADRLIGLLEQLGVPHVNFKDTKEQALPGWEDATHCLYHEDYDETELGKLRGSLPECSFVVVRNVRQAQKRVKFYDVAVYGPVLVTDMASAINLNRKPGLPALAETGGSATSLRVEDAVALVVDDNPLSLAAMCDSLHALGFAVKEASSGQEALKLSEKEAFDLIFMDYRMSALKGRKTAELMRKSRQNGKTPIVALTQDLADESRLPDAVFNDIIAKPAEENELVRAVIAWLPPAKYRQLEQNGCITSDSSSFLGFDLVGLLDEFGMYANDVIRELNGNIHAFVARLGQASSSLGSLVENLHQEMGQGDWASFASSIARLKNLLHGIGARDCAARARRMEAAAETGNIDYIRSDFKSLMGNMYMMEKKLEALMPIVSEGNTLSMAVNDPLYIYARLHDLHVSLESRNLELARDAMEDLARHSFDHSLDLLLNEVRWAMEDLDFEDARKKNTKAMAYYRSSSVVHQAYGQ